MTTLDLAPPARTPSKNVSLSMEQESAISLCTDMDEPIVGITGGAGTGKTVVLGCAYRALCDSHSVVLCAPTGRAAKRITELTGIPAVTIHRLLEFPKPDELLEDVPLEPRRDKFNRLDQNVVIVDEASMLGPTLFQQLFDALPKRGVVRFFGDNNQLPPVEEGIPPFIDVLKRFPSVELTFNFRSGDAIVGNALRILRGSIPLRNDRFEIIYTTNPTKFLLELVSTAPEFGTDKSQIIIPARTGKLGTAVVNPSLQIRFNPTGPFLRLRRFSEKVGDLAIRAGDKFLWLANDYKLDMFNGEIGVVDWIDTDSGELGLALPGRGIVTVPPLIREYNPFYGQVRARDPRKQIDLGYAITVYKAQGSEFDTVVVCMSQHNGRVLVNRRSFYTAVTRARSRVIIVTDRGGMAMSMRR